MPFLFIQRSGSSACPAAGGAASAGAAGACCGSGWFCPTASLAPSAPKGPFRILDTVGLTTAHNIVRQYLKLLPFLAPYNFRGMDKMLQKYLDEGKLGQASGEGFYSYR